ncbi:hypothetical protein J6590_056715 [Homalodisca vitripennis]|nr:hypothetical protein J6590_056715 [Homalodisca vitripennis]
MLQKLLDINDKMMKCVAKVNRNVRLKTFPSFLDNISARGRRCEVQPFPARNMGVEFVYGGLRARTSAEDQVRTLRRIYARHYTAGARAVVSYGPLGQGPCRGYGAWVSRIAEVERFILCCVGRAKVEGG